MMKSKFPKVAFAVFVKTPGLSPIKTRLGATIGQGEAEEFYSLSVGKIKSDLMFLRENTFDFTVDIFWAVAEAKHPDHENIWSDFSNVSQGDGGLGQRLSKVYTELQGRGYDSVVIMGSDSPQFGVSDYYGWCKKVPGANEAFLGPSSDGGFYCFVCNTPIEQERWLNVTYSSSNTSAELAAELDRAGVRLNLLPIGFDVDTEGDMIQLRDTLRAMPSQQKKPGSLLQFLG